MRNPTLQLQKKLASVAVCAWLCCWVSGCASGFGWFRSKPDNLFAESQDPFLDDTTEALIADAADRAEASTVSTRADLGDGSPAAAEPFVSSRGQGTQTSSAIADSDVSLTDFEPGSSSGDVQLAGGTQQTDSVLDINGSHSNTAHRGSDFESKQPRRSGAGLGSINPWSTEINPEPDSGVAVGLSFEEGIGDPTAVDRVKNFSIDADDWNPPPAASTGFDLETQAPGASEDASPERSGINIIEAPIGQLERSAGAIPEAFDALERKVREERDSLRGRFSRLGAKFGLGGEETAEAESVQPQAGAQTNADNCIEDLIARTQARLDGQTYGELDEGEQQQYLRDHVNLRLFYLVNEQSERALDAIPGIPPAEQEFWQQMFWSLVQYRDVEATPDHTDRATQTALQLRAALQRLQESAKLQIRNASFCRRINGFGSYDRFERDVFRPGQPVLVYAEIDNFKTEPTTAGQHRTLLRSTLRIFPENGSEKPVDSVTLRAVEDVSRSPRRDYFNSYEFTIPNDIAPGRYLLEITIDDRLANKAARQTVLFSVK